MPWVRMTNRAHKAFEAPIAARARAARDGIEGLRHHLFHLRAKELDWDFHLLSKHAMFKALVREEGGA